MKFKIYNNKLNVCVSNSEYFVSGDGDVFFYDLMDGELVKGGGGDFTIIPFFEKKEPSDWRPDYSKTPKRVVCAANRHRESGHIICGARHWDKVMRAQNPYDSSAGYDQGFIDQFSDWMTREEAWTVAVSQDQVRKLCYEGQQGKLYSENVW